MWDRLGTRGERSGGREKDKGAKRGVAGGGEGRGWVVKGETLKKRETWKGPGGPAEAFRSLRAEWTRKKRGT